MGILSTGVTYFSNPQQPNRLILTGSPGEGGQPPPCNYAPPAVWVNQDGQQVSGLFQSPSQFCVLGNQAYAVLPVAQAALDYFCAQNALFEVNLSTHPSSLLAIFQVSPGDVFAPDLEVTTCCHFQVKNQAKTVTIPGATTGATIEKWKMSGGTFANTLWSLQSAGTDFSLQLNGAGLSAQLHEGQVSSEAQSLLNAIIETKTITFKIRPYPGAPSTINFVQSLNYQLGS